MAKIIDHLAVKILNYVEENGNAENLNKVAKGTNTPLTTIHKRVKSLKENGVIKKAHYELDPERLGLPMLALIAIKTENDSVADNLDRKFGKTANNVISFETFGAFDYLLGRYVSSSEELYSLKDELKNFSGVEMIYPVYVGHKFRFSTVPYPLKEE